jgi:polyribonucleotide nucleotidyltransferase
MAWRGDPDDQRPDGRAGDRQDLSRQGGSLAEFGAFVEIFPGTDGLLHVSEIAEHRVKEVKDELREGDQILVKVLAIEGNRIKLSRKAVLREQRAKLSLCCQQQRWSSHPAASPKPPVQRHSARSR